MSHSSGRLSAHTAASSVVRSVAVVEVVGGGASSSSHQVSQILELGAETAEKVSVSHDALPGASKAVVGLTVTVVGVGEFNAMYASATTTVTIP